MDYWEARTARYKRNQEDILQLAKDVMIAYPEIEVYVHNSDRIISSITFFKGESINSVSFHEVPYHWSGCGFKEHGGGDNCCMPFDVNDILTTFKPVSDILLRQPNEYFKSKEQYLKWCSWLKKTTLKDEETNS